MRILVFGSTGMLGHTLIKYLQAKKNIKVEFTVRDKKKQKLCKRIFGKEAKYIVNAFNPQSALDAINKFKPDFCINCIGLLNKKDDSKNSINYIHINSLFPHHLLEYCSENNSRLIHISTDGVYSGKRGNYTEDDIPDPVDFYSKSKLLGELFNKNAITIRTSIIGPEISTSNGLLEWFKTCDSKIYGYSDVWFSGFPTVELSRIIFDFIIKNNLKNDIYNISSVPINKFNLLKLINDTYDLNKEVIEDNSIKVNRILDCSKFISETNFIKEEWIFMIKRMKAFN